MKKIEIKIERQRVPKVRTPHKPTKVIKSKKVYKRKGNRDEYDDNYIYELSHQQGEDFPKRELFKITSV